MLLDVGRKESYLEHFSKQPTAMRVPQTLAEGTPRVEYRLQHPDFDDWLVLSKGYKPAEAPRPPPPPKTTTPKPVASVLKPPATKKPWTSPEAMFGRTGKAYDLLSAIEESLEF